MKILKHIFAILICVFLLQSTASANSNQRINWFFKSQGDNRQPVVLGGDTVAEEHGALYLGKEGDKTVYLTFDAGYSNENVEKILDVLAKHEIKGAFFILPGIIKNSPETVKRMANDGHLICNHTTSHGDMSKIDDIEDFKAELEGVESLYNRLTGLEMEKYFRPPEGAFSVKTLEFCEELGYTPVFWSFAYADWDDNKQSNPEKAKAKILSCAHDGMVMLLHPTSETNALILDDVITQLKSQGYSFGTLNDLAQNHK